MPIESYPGGTVITGEAIRWFQLRSLIGRLELEMKGIRFRVSSLTVAKRTTGLRTNDRNKHIAKLREMAQAAMAKDGTFTETQQ